MLEKLNDIKHLRNIAIDKKDQHRVQFRCIQVVIGGVMPRKKKKTRDDRRAVGYIRVSTVKQAESGLSLEAQREKIEAYCQLRDLELVSIFEDAGVSASMPLADRPGGAQALALLNTDGVGHIVGLKLDRLFRNTMDCLASASAWGDEGIAFHLVDMGGQTVDTSSAMGKFFLTLMAGIAEWERNVISERTIMALQLKADLGHDLGRAPYGSCWDTEAHVLVAAPSELKVIESVLRMRQTGMSLRSLAALLNNNGVLARGKTWHATTIARILQRDKARRRKEEDSAGATVQEV